MADPVLAEAAERSADPAAAGLAVARLTERRPGAADRLHADTGLLSAVVAVGAASPHLSRLLTADPAALDVLARLADRPELDRADPAALARWKRLEQLRIAARDLLGMDALEATGSALAQLADDVLADAVRLAGVDGADLSVIGMGKLGGRELNYASDIDIMFVGEADARKPLAIARQAWKVDVDLRPEGRSGPLTRSLESYRVYWDRWAQTWEFQALIKARAVAGQRELGAEFMQAATERVWTRPFGADDLRAVRSMKARTEGDVARKGLSTRELKRGPGGIRDIEFAVQLLQLVHGRADSVLRSPTTLIALSELATAGYVAAEDAQALELAYRFLRAAEHRLQLVEDQQVHALPTDAAGRTRLARVMGFRDDSRSTATAYFEAELRRHQATVRSIHERLFFRPLLEAFTRAPSTRRKPSSEEPTTGLSGAAIADRLAAFGFSDADRTRQAVQELTKGFTRSSRLMQQLLPLLFGWLSDSPDPDLGLLGLRSLATGQHRRDQLVALFRESPEAARRLCLLLGTSPLFNRAFERQPELLAELASGDVLGSGPTRAELIGDRGRGREVLDAASRAGLPRLSGPPEGPPNPNLLGLGAGPDPIDPAGTDRPDDGIGTDPPDTDTDTARIRVDTDTNTNTDTGITSPAEDSVATARQPNGLAVFRAGSSTLAQAAFASGDGARTKDELRVQASTSLSWRAGPDERRHGLERLVRSEWLRLAAGDVLGLRDVTTTERGLSTLAEVVLETALNEIEPKVPFAVVAMGRFG
ncbi:MAG: [glutamine synthetase] adenylyltransferase / [glutamine synthetase]-adenylyl-L-tyrosine, partial [Acidimicrobiaceae bacterium]|nr:[glutamine synthetase] adenylyltransferase / [glutamine synthetase]-adenylyl-L-tyrosine [Acidimicrobiaceae bacterium]